MAVTYKVNSQDLRTVANELRNKNNQFRQRVQELGSQEGRLHGQWEGDSHDIFHNAFTRDRSQFETFASGIDQYIRALEEAARKYEEAEDRSRILARDRKA